MLALVTNLDEPKPHTPGVHSQGGPDMPDDARGPVLLRERDLLVQVDGGIVPGAKDKECSRFINVTKEPVILPIIAVGDTHLSVLTHLAQGMPFTPLAP